MTDGEAAYRALDPGWQRAAELLAQGLSETDAHAGAFPESRATRKSRCDLMRRARSEKVGFQAAVDWLTARAAERGIIDVEHWWRSATEIHGFDPRKLVLLTRGELDPADMTEAEAAAICGWTERYDPVTGAVVSRSIKVTPRKDVLRLTQAPLGITTERVELADAEGARAKLEEALSRRRKAEHAGD